MYANGNRFSVSCGSFSCSLEGFDNAANTAMAVAEFFRDLTVQDRHFGAEPPSPTLELLARAAKQRLVPARISEAEILG